MVNVRYIFSMFKSLNYAFDALKYFIMYRQYDYADLGLNLQKIEVK